MGEKKEEKKSLNVYIYLKVRRQHVYVARNKQKDVLNTLIQDIDNSDTTCIRSVYIDKIHMFYILLSININGKQVSLNISLSLYKAADCLPSDLSSRR